MDDSLDRLRRELEVVFHPQLQRLSVGASNSVMIALETTGLRRHGVPMTKRLSP
jgi:hypothetical protein